MRDVIDREKALGYLGVKAMFCELAENDARQRAFEEAAEIIRNMPGTCPPSPSKL